jgi:pre-60S factor REI1
MRAASQEPSRSSTAGGITPLLVCTTTTVQEDEDAALPDESTSNSMEVNAADYSSTRRDEEIEELDMDPSCCFMCDLKHGSVDDCLVHLHRKHGFFVPDSEYLKDPGGFVTYVGLKVRSEAYLLSCVTSSNVLFITVSGLKSLFMLCMLGYSA